MNINNGHLMRFEELQAGMELEMMMKKNNVSPCSSGIAG